MLAAGGWGYGPLQALKHPLEEEKRSGLSMGRGAPEKPAKLLGNCGDLGGLPGELVLAQLFQAVAKATL